MDNQHIRSGVKSPRLAGEGAAAVADRMVWAWNDISLVLTPIVGARGVAALHNRSVHLTAKAFPWLVVKPGNIEATIDLDALHTLLNQQSVAAATAGGEAHLRSFHDLLATLIGLSLTERLLLPVWEKYLSASTAQDPSR